MAAIDSFSRIQRVLSILSHHPDGLPLDLIADELNVSVRTLRKEIFDYYTAEVNPADLLGLVRPEVIDFVSSDGDVVDPKLAPKLRLTADQPESELGVQLLTATQLARLYEAASGLAEIEQDNEVLASAAKKLGESFLGDPFSEESPDGDSAALLRAAVDQRRAVEIEYSREWIPGVGRRIVHPYRLVKTGRGWELDAGPMADGSARTFIVKRIRSVVLLEDRFERPPGLDAMLDAERAEVAVELSLPQGTHWVVDRFAERTTVLNSDSQDFTVKADFLPPVSDRVSLVLIIAGDSAFVVTPDALNGGADQLRAVLRAHHGFPDD